MTKPNIVSIMKYNDRKEMANMNTSAYESTVSMMSGLDDADLMLIKEFIIRISSKDKYDLIYYSYFFKG